MEAACAAVEQLEPVADRALALALGRQPDGHAVFVATSEEVESRIDIEGVRERLKEGQRAAGREDDLEKAEVELDFHLLGVAFQRTVEDDDPAQEHGGLTVMLDAERLAATSQRLGVPLEALVLTVLIHEKVHISMDRVSGERGGRAVGGWDAEVEAQRLTHEALQRLAMGEGDDADLAREALAAMYALAQAQSAPYTQFLDGNDASSTFALMRAPGDPVAVGLTTTDFLSLEDLLDGSAWLEVTCGPEVRVAYGSRLFVLDMTEYERLQAAWLKNKPSQFPEVERWIAEGPSRESIPVAGPFVVTGVRHETASMSVRLNGRAAEVRQVDASGFPHRPLGELVQWSPVA